MAITEKLPPRLAWGTPFKAKYVQIFKPVACFRCGTMTFNAKLMTTKRRLPKMQLICSECGRKTKIIVKRFE